MAQYREQYDTPEEMQAIINDYVGVRGKFHIEIQNHIDGDFLLFDDVEPDHSNPEREAKESFRALVLLQKTKEERDTWVDNADAAQIKTALKLLADAVVYLAKHQRM